MTDLQPLRGSNHFLFDSEEVKALLIGNFRTRKCITCDGTGWVHFKDGVIIGTGFRKDWTHEDPAEWISSDGCEDCLGFGQIIKFNED